MNTISPRNNDFEIHRHFDAAERNRSAYNAARFRIFSLFLFAGKSFLSHKGFPGRVMLIIGQFFLFSTCVQAVDQLLLEIEQVEYSGWSIENLRLNLSSNTDKTNGDTQSDLSQLMITAESISPPTGDPFKDLHFHCDIEQSKSSPFKRLSSCSSGRFSTGHKKLGQVEGEAGFHYQPNTGVFNLDLSKLHLAGGAVNFAGELTQHGWSINLDGRSVDVAELKKLVVLFMSWPAGISDESGKLKWDLSMTGQGEFIDSVRLKLKTSKLAFDGRSVAEDLDAELNVTAKKEGSTWLVTEALKLKNGAIYFEPGFKVFDAMPGFLLEPAKEDIEQELQGSWDKENFLMDHFSFSHPEVITADGSGKFLIKQEKPIEKLNISLSTNELGKVFPVYLQPLLFGTGLDQMEIIGQTDLTLKLSQGSITDFHLIVNDVYFDDKDDRFHVAGLNGDVRLNSEPEPILSNMSWRAGSIYKMNIGTGEMKLSSEGRSMTLREKTLIPIFDGGLQIDDMKLDNLGLGNYSVQIDSRLTPVTLSEFTEAMGWPIMAGSVFGEIPGLSYHNGTLSVDGVLNVNVFGGDIFIRQLQIEELFNKIPVLYSDILIKDLDLGVLSQTFEFGNITGKLSGYMKNLRMKDWQPVQFDASFFTPENDKSKHRISQRAIDNITSIGGGGSSNVISRGILGIFKEFPYSKLGLSCVLKDDKCEMDGIAQAGDAYYIVKRGFFPPWLEIKGYNRDVDWLELLERLKNISASEAPIIE